MIRPDAELLLDIQDLHASVEDKPILNGVNLQVRAGEVHAVMGRNGMDFTSLHLQIDALEDGLVLDGGMQVLNVEQQLSVRANHGRRR